MAELPSMTDLANQLHIIRLERDQIQQVNAERITQLESALMSELSTRQQLSEEVTRLRNIEMTSAAANQRIEDPSRQNLPKGFKIPTVDTFSGRREEDLLSWIFQVEEQFSLYGLEDETMQIRCAGQCLRGAARIWFTHTKVLDTIKELNWASFKEAMLAHFGPTDPVKLARDELAEVKQEKGVMEYSAQFRSICTRITAISKEEMLDRYVRGLKPRTRKEVEMKEPDTVEAAMRIAEKFDRITDRLFEQGRTSQASSHRATSNSYTSNRGNPSYSRPTGPTPMDLNAMNEARRGPLTQEERDRRRAQGLCAYCGGNNHQVNECPLSIRNKAKNGLRRPQGARW